MSILDTAFDVDDRINNVYADVDRVGDKQLTRKLWSNLRKRFLDSSLYAVCIFVQDCDIILYLDQLNE